MKRCPFCGSKDVGPSEDGWGNFYIHCFDCGTRGPIHNEHNGALELWNKRKEQS